jgi:hypothetical protein
MTISLEDQKESFMERLERLSQTMRLAILVSFFWPIFSVIHIWEPRGRFYFQAFIKKFILMGVLPLVIFCGIWWVLQELRKR